MVLSCPGAFLGTASGTASTGFTAESIAVAGTAAELAAVGAGCSAAAASVQSPPPYSPPPPPANIVTVIARHVLWPKVRMHVRLVRPIALYWLDVTMRSGCAPGGNFRKRDREAFESDFCGESTATDELPWPLSRDTSDKTEQGEPSEM